jgi:hypothetical protein
MSSIQQFQETFKNASVEELLAIIAAATAEAKKKAKVVVKEATKEKAPKEKKGSMPKGVLPVQLQLSFAYVDYTLAQANKNGWKEFTVKGQAAAMEASVERDGAHVFPSTGKPLNRKQAMSLSKYLWSNKEQKGADKAFYDAFVAQYVPPAAPVAAEAPVEAVVEVEEKKEEPAPKPKKESKPKKTDEEKAAEKAAKEEKKAAKEPKAAEKDEAEAPKAVTPKKITKKVAKKEAEVPFDCEDDDMCRPWVFEGKPVFRNFKGFMWERLDGDEAGAYLGQYDKETKTVDASVEEPTYDDE